MRDRADSFTPSDEWGSFQFTTSADAKRAEHMFNQLSSERDALKALNAELVLGMQEIFNEAGPACTPNDWPKLHNIRLLAKAVLAKVSK